MPCTECADGMWKWGERGECRYSSREECERANEGNKEWEDAHARRPDLYPKPPWMKIDPAYGPFMDPGCGDC